LGCFMTSHGATKKMAKKRSNKTSMRKADKVFSEYVRLRDADNQGNIECISCGRKVHWSESDAGHFIDRRHKATRFDERNVNAQCRSCNRFQSGRQFEQSINIDLRYGKGTAHELLAVSRQISKRTAEWYDEIARDYGEQSNEIRRQKGL